MIDRAHRDELGPYGNLGKLAAIIASGMHRAFITAQSVGGFYPTKEELNKAATWALEEFLNHGYILPTKPNGSMTKGEMELKR